MFLLQNVSSYEQRPLETRALNGKQSHFTSAVKVAGYRECVTTGKEAARQFRWGEFLVCWAHSRCPTNGCRLNGWGETSNADPREESFLFQPTMKLKEKNQLQSKHSEGITGYSCTVCFDVFCIWLYLICCKHTGFIYAHEYRLVSKMF